MFDRSSLRPGGVRARPGEAPSALEKHPIKMNRKALIRLSIVLLFGLLVAWLAFGDRGLIHLYRMEKKRQAYEQHIQSLEMRNQALLEKIERLKKDKEYIESVARKELNLLKEDEIHFHFAEDPESGITSQGGTGAAAVP